MYNGQPEYTYKNLLEDLSKPNSGVALLVIDVQNTYCNPKSWGSKETVKISKKINSIVPKFRKASIPVYSIYLSASETTTPDFYNYKHKKEDTLIRKTSCSVFKDSYPNIEESFAEKGIKTILACGFNQCACVKASLLDASKEFNTFLLEDLSGNDKFNRKLVRSEYNSKICYDENELTARKYMFEAGVQFINNSKKFLKDMKAVRPKKAVTNV